MDGIKIHDLPIDRNIDGTEKIVSSESETNADKNKTKQIVLSDLKSYIIGDTIEQINDPWEDFSA